jgi:chromosomal replication initiation ATPase DnaA
MALDLNLPESHALDDFVVTEANRAAFRHVAEEEWTQRALLLCGEKGAGKSHLAAIWAEKTGARRLSAKELSVDLLRQNLVTGALILEDAGADTPSLPFFHLLNLIKEEDAQLLITCATMPALWGVNLKDLASRLRAIPVATLFAPDEALMRMVALKLCADKGLSLEKTVLDFILNRSERSLGALRESITRLDRVSLEKRQKITRALAQEVLEVNP